MLNSKAEGGATDTIKGSEQKGITHCRDWCFGKDFTKLRNGEPGDQQWQDEPANGCLREPEGLPAPAAGAFLRGITECGGGRADCMQEHAEDGIG
jgi:hypothetical protein